jgi:hypothetical protein
LQWFATEAPAQPTSEIASNTKTSARTNFARFEQILLDTLFPPANEILQSSILTSLHSTDRCVAIMQPAVLPLEGARGIEDCLRL